MNTFGSKKEYFRQVFEWPVNGGFKLTGVFVLGVLLQIATVLAILWTATDSGQGNKPGLILAVVLACQCLYWGVPLFHSEYGIKKQGRD